MPALLFLAPCPNLSLVAKKALEGQFLQNALYSAVQNDPEGAHRAVAIVNTKALHASVVFAERLRKESTTQSVHHQTQRNLFGAAHELISTPLSPDTLHETSLKQAPHQLGDIRLRKPFSLSNHRYRECSARLLRENKQAP